MLTLCHSKQQLHPQPNKHPTLNRLLQQIHDFYAIPTGIDQQNHPHKHHGRVYQRNREVHLPKNQLSSQSAGIQRECSLRHLHHTVPLLGHELSELF